MDADELYSQQISVPAVELEFIDPNIPIVGEREHYSTFFVTINTNRKANRKRTEEFKQALGGPDGVFARRNIKHFVNILERGKIYRGSTIKEVKVKYALEVGPKMHRLHAHAIISFIHYTKLQLSRPKLKAQLERRGFPGCYINIKFMKGTLGAEAYMRKYLPEFAPADVAVIEKTLASQTI